MHNPNRPLPPLDLVRGFEAAARRLSFTQAAKELFLTQSAVSRQVQALEAFLGVKLFERRHKALILSEPGQAYYRVANAALSELRAVTQRLQESRRGRVLTVTTTVSFASIWLVPRLTGVLAPLGERLGLAWGAMARSAMLPSTSPPIWMVKSTFIPPAAPSDRYPFRSGWVLG